MNKGGFTALFMDAKCFVGTIMKVLKHEGVAEGKSAAPQTVEEKNTVQK